LAQALLAVSSDQPPAVSSFQPLQAWRAGTSAGQATVYISNVVAATAKIRQLSPDDVALKAMLLKVMMAGVGVIEEYDRLLRLLPDVAISQHQSAEPLPLDPRRRIRTPVKPAEFPVVEDGLKKLCAATEQRIATVQKIAAASPSPAHDVFELARYIHALPATPDKRRLLDLTKRAGLPPRRMEIIPLTTRGTICSAETEKSPSPSKTSAPPRKSFTPSR